MADPTPYTRTYSFTDYQSGNPSAPLPGVQVDNELENIEQSLGEAVDAIKDVRRSDGALVNGIVTVDSLSPQVASGVGAGALASAAAAAASADAASDSAVASAASATASAGSATTASGYASTALIYRNEAETERTLAQTARTGAQDARDYANKWATEAEDVNVDDGVNPVGRSAYNWAQKAAASAASLDLPLVAADTLLGGNAAGDAWVTKTFSEVRAALDVPVYAETRTALKALDTTNDTVAYLNESGREGIFEWAAGDFSAQITADTLEGVYVKADAIASTAGAWVRSGVVEVLPKWFGAAVDGMTDDTAECQAAATIAELIGADLRFPEGRYVLDPASGTALSMTTYAHGDVSLQAALVIPYKVRVRTSGTLTEFLCKNLNATTSVAIAIGEDGTTGAGHSQQSFRCDGFMIRAIASTGRYGIVAPKNTDLFSRKRPKYQIDHIHFAGEADADTVLQTPDEGWAVGVLIGDTYGYTGKITGQGTFLATATPTGQHQMTGFKCSASVGAFGIHLNMIMKSVYRGIELSDGVEGFEITGSEIWDSFYGIETSNASSEPGGFIDNVHVNAVRECFRISNRSQIHIGKVECYRADGYYTDGATAWYGIRAISSEIDVATVHGNVGDTFNTEITPALVHADSNSVVSIEQWRARGLRRVAVFDGSADCKLGDGSIDNTTAIDTIIALGDGASDIQGGNVRVRAGTVSNYFTVSGTVDKGRLTFPATTSIQTSKHDEIAPTAAGTTTIKPRLTASDLQVAMQAGAGAHTYDVIIDHASAIDGDEVVVKVVGSSSANPTLRICSGSTATVLSSFNNITGTKRLWCRYVYSAANNLWRELIADSIESTY